jgi:hypothetical protein
VKTFQKAVRDTCYWAIFLLSLTAVFWIESYVYLLINTFVMIFFVALMTNKFREVWPVLFITVLLVTIDLIIAFSITEPLALFLLLSLFDLFIAFSIVHYHRDKFLLKICRVQFPSRQVPQVYIISFVLALSSLYSFLLGTEMVFYTLDKQIFAGSEPFFYSIYEPTKVAIKIMFDLSVWSLVLVPSRWRFLRKIEQRFDL